MFNFKQSIIFQTVKYYRFFGFRFAKTLKKIFSNFFMLFFIIFLYGFLIGDFSIASLSKLFGLSILFLSFFLFFFIEDRFWETKLKDPKLPSSLQEALVDPEKYNLADFLDFKTGRAVVGCKNDLSLLLLRLLKKNSELDFVFYRALIDPKSLRKALKYTLKDRNLSSSGTVSYEFISMIQESMKVAVTKGHERVRIGDMITALSKYEPIFKKLLSATDLRVGDIENLTWWLESLRERFKKRQKFWEWNNLVKRGSLAKQWTAGYTITLDKFSTDLSEVYRRQGFPEVIGHQKEIEMMERNLSRAERNNSVLVVGEAGSGRRSMIQALAERSFLGESLPEINYKRVVQLDLTSLLAQFDNPENASKVLDLVFREALSAGNIILVIDNLHNFIGLQADRPGVMDISGVLAPYLPYPQFQIVAVTTFEGLHKNLETNQAILSLFEKVEVSEVSENETLMILENLALTLERKYRKFVSYKALRDIISYCAKYLSSTPFPEKAMNLLEEAMVRLTQMKGKVLLSKDIAKLISEKTQIPVGEMEDREKEVLLNLEDLIHQRIINQEEAVGEISSALRRARTEVTMRNGPMGTFLFLGPTGVGKTETSKALAEIYFGSENRMIRLDMSEFQSVSDIPRMLGSAGEEGLLTTKIRENPFSLLLLDEIEKAHPNILNLFLQVLDEGYLTDGLGRKTDFTNTIIIATSNAGYQVILEALKESKPTEEIKEQLLDYLFKEGLFRPEFINRFDGVVIFKSLSKENLLAIAELLLQKMKKNLSEKEIEFIITPELKEKIVELSYDPKFGAREMRRVIQDKVENILAVAILSGQLKKGYTVRIDPDGFKLIING